jgi:hypothetical protein
VKQLELDVKRDLLLTHKMTAMPSRLMCIEQHQNYPSKKTSLLLADLSEHDNGACMHLVGLPGPQSAEPCDSPTNPAQHAARN